MIRPTLLLALLLGVAACTRAEAPPADPALSDAPLTDCSNEAFVRILGGGRAAICRGEEKDPATRACLAPHWEAKRPVAVVVPDLPGEPQMATVRTPEGPVFQVRRFPGDRVELWSCARVAEIPADELPYACPTAGEGVSPIQTADACAVLARAREIRRTQAAR